MLLSGDISLLNDWVFIGDGNLLAAQTDYVYHKLMTKYRWLEDKVTRR